MDREHFLASGLPECQCASAGYCPIFRKTFGPTLHAKCQTSQAFRNQFLGIVSQQENDPLYEEKRKQLEEKHGQAQAFDRAVKELKDAGISLKDESAGLGDTVEKVLSKFGITKGLMENVVGMKGCRCDERKAWLNKIFPYKKKKK